MFDRPLPPQGAGKSSMSWSPRTRELLKNQAGNRHISIRISFPSNVHPTRGCCTYLARCRSGASRWVNQSHGHVLQMREGLSLFLGYLRLETTLISHMESIISRGCLLACASPPLDNLAQISVRFVHVMMHYARQHKRDKPKLDLPRETSHRSSTHPLPQEDCFVTNKHKRCM